jgi:altronate hydrolase
MKAIKIHPDDNVAVALSSLKTGDRLDIDGQQVVLLEDIPIKHKFSLESGGVGTKYRMYGVVIGKATQSIQIGQRFRLENLTHATNPYSEKQKQYSWAAPSVDDWQGLTFSGYHRVDGRVGTRNYWLVIPLVFCENRNVEVLREMLEEALGFQGRNQQLLDLQPLLRAYHKGASSEELLELSLAPPSSWKAQHRVFQNLDGIRFLTHEGGCGGTRQDAQILCQLLAGYIQHPNVAGATVLSLGCQNAQIPLLQKALNHWPKAHQKPVYYLEQQQSRPERDFIAEAVKKTFVGCIQANSETRRPASLSHLCLGLECGGSDGFSGISANPVLGHCTDMLVSLGAKAILAEFPELNGVEQALMDRCTSEALAKKFGMLMSAYSERAKEAGTDFAWNPSPGNIRDGLITDAMKSAGAVKKGGDSPIVDVLDYTEPVSRAGLSLLCTPGNDVESTTGLAGSGANLIAFTTGLGTPTGNPISPTIKISSNTNLAQRMPGLIDFDTGAVIRGEQTIADLGADLFNLLVATASGKYLTKAELLSQNDFIPWKRGISL